MLYGNVIHIHGDFHGCEHCTHQDKFLSFLSQHIHMHPTRFFEDFHHQLVHNYFLELQHLPRHYLHTHVVQILRIHLWLNP